MLGKALHLAEDRPGCGGRIRSLGDGAADDEVAGSRGKGVGGRSDALLVADGGAGGANPRNDESGGGVAAAHRGDFFGARDKTVDAGGDGSLGEMENLVGWSAIDADGLELLAIHAGEDGDGQELGCAGDGSGSLSGGFEHGRASGSVNRKQPGPEGRDRANGAGDGVRDVVELEIEEDGEAPAAQFADDGGAFCAEELEADFDPAADSVEAIGEGEGRSGIRIIEGDDQAGVDGLGHRFMMARIESPEGGRREIREGGAETRAAWN